MVKLLIRLLCLPLFILMMIPLAAAGQPVFDVHIHYSHDVWDPIPPKDAVQLLRKAGISRALVSSSGDDGTQMLYQAAPDLVIPSLRPYRKRGELYNWMHDDSVIPYLKQRLAKYQYAAIGEFHISGAQADLPVVRQLVQLAHEHGLILHAHADADAIERLFTQDPDARILWAHAGFEPGAKVKELLDRYPKLWADLSFRWMIISEGNFEPGWRELLINHADRFMLGVDTYTPQRWVEIDETLEWYEEMFALLPDDVANRIRYQNAERVIGRHFDSILKSE